MKPIGPGDLGPRCLEILYKYKVYGPGTDGKGGASKQMQDYLNAELVNRNPPNLYIALTQAICKWCSDTNANHMEKYVMIDSLALTLEGTNPVFKMKMIEDRAKVHAHMKLNNESLLDALYMIDAIHEQQKEMK